MRDGAGTSVTELSIVLGLSAIIAAALLTTLGSGVRTEAGHRARSEALDELRAGVNRVTKDVRQALSIDASSDARRLHFTTLVGGSAVSVVYEPAGDTLVRTVDGGSPYALVDRLVSPATMFTYDEAPPASSLVGISVAVRPDTPGASAVTLSTRVHLRNSTTL